jgi:hypothetical protein
MNEFQRFGACQLGLMNADLAARTLGEISTACAAERDKLRRLLWETGFELKPGHGKALLAEDYGCLVDAVAAGGLEQTIALLVELCASQPWGVLRGSPALLETPRERFLGRLAVDLPGACDEDDVERIDEYLNKAWEAEWGVGRFLLVGGATVALGVMTAGIGAALIAGGGALAAGSAVAAAVVGATTAEVAAAAAATVLVGVSGGLGTAVLTNEMSPALVDRAVLKRYALIRILLSYSAERPNARRQFQELTQAHAALVTRRERMIDRATRDELDHKIRSFERAIKRLRSEFD